MVDDVGSVELTVWVGVLLELIEPDGPDPAQPQSSTAAVMIIADLAAPNRIEDRI